MVNIIQEIIQEINILMDNLKLDKMSREDLLYFRDSHMSLIHKWQRMIRDIDDELHKRRNDNEKSK